MAPRVLISDELSDAAVQIFKDRGIEVDFQPTLGKDKDKLAEVIGQYDGLAIRSATKVTPTILEAATNLKVIGRAGIGVDNVDREAASKKGVIVINCARGGLVDEAAVRELLESGHIQAAAFDVAVEVLEALKGVKMPVCGINSHLLPRVWMRVILMHVTVGPRARFCASFVVGIRVFTTA